MTNRTRLTYQQCPAAGKRTVTPYLTQARGRATYASLNTSAAKRTSADGASTSPNAKSGTLKTASKAANTSAVRL